MKKTHRISEQDARRPWKSRRAGQPPHLSSFVGVCPSLPGATPPHGFGRHSGKHADIGCSASHRTRSGRLFRERPGCAPFHARGPDSARRSVHRRIAFPVAVDRAFHRNRHPHRPGYPEGCVLSAEPVPNPVLRHTPAWGRGQPLHQRYRQHVGWSPTRNDPDRRQPGHPACFSCVHAADQSGHHAGRRAGHARLRLDLQHDCEAFSPHVPGTGPCPRRTERICGGNGQPAEDRSRLWI